MTGLKSAVLTLLALSCLTALAESHRRTLHWWNPITWLREKEDRRLAASVQHFFSNLKQEGEDTTEDNNGEGGDADKKEEKKELIEQLDGNRVKILNDTIISDYIFIEYWQFEPEYDDVNNPSEEQPADSASGDATEQKPTPQVQQEDSEGDDGNNDEQSQE